MGSRARLGVGLVVLGLALPASASATTWQVTNTGDGPFTCPSVSSCTLRGAIAQADGDSGDLVQVPAGLYTVNVNPINVTQSMQIVGTAGSAATTVAHSGGTTGILAIGSGASNVTVSGLTLTGGEEPNGGAIASQAAALTLADDVFTGNAPGVAGSQGHGGAVDVTGSAATTLTVTNSSFSANRAGSDGTSTFESGIGLGGGIAFQTGGRLSVSDSTFSGNRAGGAGGSNTQTGAGAGGAIYVSPTTPTDAVDVEIVRSAFSDNHAGGNGASGGGSGSGDGGALAVETDPGPGSLTVADSTFADNTAGGKGDTGSGSGDGNGGAIGIFGNEGSAITMTVTGSTFADNRGGGDGSATAGAGQGGGGGFYFSSDSASSTASAVNSTFDGNRAGGVAGTGANSGEAVGGTITANTPGSLALTNDTLVGGNAGGENGKGGNLGTIGGGMTTLKNTILSHGVADTGSNCSGPVTSLGHNIETANDCGLTAAGDRPNTEPSLGALASNGGLTQTIALSPGSPAIDGGDSGGCPATDQRGVLRPAGASCDVGAFEVATPGATTGPAGSIHATSATLAGVAFNPDLGPGSAAFQFGTSTSYGSGAGSLAIGAVTGAGAVGTTVKGLKPRTTYHFRLVVSNGIGTAAGADQTFTTTAGATITNLSLRPSSIVAESGRGASVTRKKTKHLGATLRFRASVPGVTTFTVQRPRRGYRSGKRCVAKKPHGKGKPRRCTLYKSRGSFKLKTSSGTNSTHFTGRVKRRPLRLGSYRLTAVETDSDGHKGKATARAFRIVR